MTCRPGGLAVIVSPHSWLPGWTPKDKWLGGYNKVDCEGEQIAREGLFFMTHLDPCSLQGGKPVYTASSMSEILSKDFDLIAREDMPFLIRCVIFLSCQSSDRRREEAHPCPCLDQGARAQVPVGVQQRRRVEA